MSVAVTVAGLCVPVVSPAQGVYAYPQAGQSQQQQQKDTSECHIWAVNQSGYDPSRPAPAPAPTYSSPPPSSGAQRGIFGRGSYGQGGGIADAGKGAAGGALIGAIAGDAGKGAAIGAVSGLFIGGVKRSNAEAERQQWEQQQAQQQAQQQQAAAAQNAQGRQQYERAFATCMRGRKYQVG
jgi:hypothetical protein